MIFSKNTKYSEKNEKLRVKLMKNKIIEKIFFQLKSRRNEKS